MSGELFKRAGRIERLGAEGKPREIRIPTWPWRWHGWRVPLPDIAARRALEKLCDYVVTRTG